MDPYIYEIKMPPKLANMLKGMVNLARKNEVLTLSFNATYGSDVEEIIFLITAGNETESFPQTTNDAMYALNCLHLITQLGDFKTIFLTNYAYEWVDYQRQWRITKWVQRNWHHAKYIFVVVIPALVSIITTLIANSLSGLQIIEILKRLGLIQ